LGFKSARPVRPNRAGAFIEWRQENPDVFSFEDEPLTPGFQWTDGWFLTRISNGAAKIATSIASKEQSDRVAMS